MVIATLVVYPVTQGSVQEEAETQARDEAREAAWKTRITAGPYFQVVDEKYNSPGRIVMGGGANVFGPLADPRRRPWGRLLLPWAV